MNINNASNRHSKMKFLAPDGVDGGATATIDALPPLPNISDIYKQALAKQQGKESGTTPEPVPDPTPTQPGESKPSAPDPEPVAAEPAKPTSALDAALED